MPGDKTSAPAADKPPVNPDLVGEELADNANIWHIYDRVAKEDDERRTKSWDAGLNNLALFAGLFSAVTTAFIIEARQDLEPDYAQLAFLVLNATAFGEKPVHEPFVIPSSARTVNCLWIASLILSLSAALIAIMGKDWIGMYTARPVCNLRQWAEMRTYRLLCVERWYMSGVIAAAPVLLHVSLVLFGAGLVLFISSDPFTHRLTLGLSLAAGVLYLVTTFSAVIFSTSPFKSPATQMIRAALSALCSYIRRAIRRPKQNLVGTLLRNINTIIAGGGDDTTLLPGSAPGTQLASVRPQARAILPLAIGAAIAYMRKLPNLVRASRHNLQWPLVRLQLHSVAETARRIPVSDWFLASTWSDLPAERRPKLLADALMWLSGASQANEVFRAIVFALGDLDIGPQVGLHTSIMMHTRLRAEIRRIWRQADFLTLSRFVLADHNTPGEPALTARQFDDQFDLSKDPALRCEDGLAALVIVHSGSVQPRKLMQYFPDQVAQPKMLGFLLPHIQGSGTSHTNVLVLLSNLYRTHLRTTDSFNLRNLEAHLYQTLDAYTRDRYATAVTGNYGGNAGAMELLAFLCCDQWNAIDDITKPAAVGLVMELLAMERLPVSEHRCLVYLFGTSKLWDATWKDKLWSPDSLDGLTSSLQTSCFHPFEPSSVRTLSDDRQFDLALARTVVMMLSPRNTGFGRDLHWLEFLHGYLCQAPSHNPPDSNEMTDIIRLILEHAAVLGIVLTSICFLTSDEIFAMGTASLAAIINDVGRRLGDPATSHDGEQLFKLLVFTEFKGSKGESRTWDLGEWLQALAVVTRRSPSLAAAMQDVYDALSALYPLCEHNSQLRGHWERIGNPGRPGDILSENADDSLLSDSDKSSRSMRTERHV